MATINGNLTQLLKPLYQKLGYSLSRDAYFYYLYSPGAVTPKRFSVSNETDQSLNNWIEGQETLLHLFDFWKHPGKED